MVNIFGALMAKARGHISSREFNEYTHEHKFDDCEAYEERYDY